MAILPYLFVLAPLAIYLVVALRKGRTPVTADEFFELRGLTSPSEFANSLGRVRLPDHPRPLVRRTCSDCSIRARL